MTFLKNKSILITGGTGSFGKAFCSKILSKYKDLRKLVIFSRDEFKQFEMEKVFSTLKYKNIRYFLGDVRDQKRLSKAFEDIDIVIHAAALKQVDKAEYNPLEYIKTNINNNWILSTQGINFPAIITTYTYIPSISNLAADSQELCVLRITRFL